MQEQLYNIFHNHCFLLITYNICLKKKKKEKMYRKNIKMYRKT